jgi:hypothetical protein
MLSATAIVVLVQRHRARTPMVLVIVISLVPTDSPNQIAEGVIVLHARVLYAFQYAICI